MSLGHKASDRKEEALKRHKGYEERAEKYFQKTVNEIQGVIYDNEISKFFYRIPIQMAKQRPDIWSVASDLSEHTLQVVIQWIKNHDLNRRVKFWTPYVLPLLEKKLKTYRKSTSQTSMAYAKIKEQYTVEALAETHTNLSRGSGGRRKGICPLHNDTAPSFTVYLKDDSFYCFGCHKGGDVITLFYALREKI